jgi:hypothetical protein
MVIIDTIITLPLIIQTYHITSALDGAYISCDLYQQSTLCKIVQY